jgi:hypothetical protein
MLWMMMHGGLEGWLSFIIAITLWVVVCDDDDHDDDAVIECT